MLQASRQIHGSLPPWMTWEHRKAGAVSRRLLNNSSIHQAPLTRGVLPSGAQFHISTTIDSTLFHLWDRQRAYYSGFSSINVDCPNSAEDGICFWVCRTGRHHLSPLYLGTSRSLMQSNCPPLAPAASPKPSWKPGFGAQAAEAPGPSDSPGS